MLGRRVHIGTSIAVLAVAGGARRATHGSSHARSRRCTTSVRAARDCDRPSSRRSSSDLSLPDRRRQSASSSARRCSSEAVRARRAAARARRAAPRAARAAARARSARTAASGSSTGRRAVGASASRCVQRSSRWPGCFGSRCTSSFSSRRVERLRRRRRSRRSGAAARCASSARRPSAGRAASARRGSRPPTAAGRAPRRRAGGTSPCASPGPVASRAQPSVPRLCAAARTSDSSSSITGSRFVAWLHASRSAFSVSGYCSGVVRCFSIRQPSTRSSTGSRRWIVTAESLEPATIGP